MILQVVYRLLYGGRVYVFTLSYKVVECFYGHVHGGIWDCLALVYSVFGFRVVSVAHIKKLYKTYKHLYETDSKTTMLEN